jgi:hypothetical protein
MSFFEKNVGKTDQIIRIILGLLIMLSSLLLMPITNYIVALIGLILVLTGVFGTCGLYKVFGINTCKVKK